MMGNLVQNIGAATRSLFDEIELALDACPIDANGLLQKMDMLHKRHLLLTVNSASLKEQYNGNDYKEYVNKTVQAVANVLLKTKPAYTSENPVQHLRGMALNHIYFIGIDHLAVLDEATLRSFLNAFIKLYEEDNEENCLLGFRIIIKLFEDIDLTVATHLGIIIENQLKKLYKQIMECYQDINFEVCLYTSVNGLYTIQALLESLHSPLLVFGSGNHKIMVLPRASKSLKVLAETPRVFNHILELWYLGYGGGLNEKNQNDVVETFLKIINLKCDDKLRKNPNFCNDAYLVFLELQISCLEFLLNLQLLHKEITNHNDVKSLSCGFLSLMKICPPNAIYLREKLVKIFHVILSLKFVIDEEEIEVMKRDYFIQYVEHLLLDDFLSYNGLVPCNGVRAAYFHVLLRFLREVHHLLPKEKIRLIIKYFLHFICDSSLPLQIHNTICLLLVTFAKCREENMDFFSAQLLIEMLQAFNMRLQVFVERDLPFVQKKLKECKTFFDCEDYCCPDFSYYHHIQNPSSKFISDFKKSTLKKTIDESKNSFGIKVCKDLIENIFQSVYGITRLYIRWQQAISLYSGNLNFIHPFSDFLKYSVQAMGLYRIPNKSYASPDITLKKHHELLRLVAEIFILLPPTDLPKIFSANVNILLDEMRQDPLLKVFLQILLLNASTGELIAVFLDFILKHLRDFDDEKKSPTLFSVLHDIVIALMKFDLKDAVLEVYLLPMIGKCMDLIPSAKEPCNFLKVIHQLILAVKTDNIKTDIGRSLRSNLPSFTRTLYSWYKISTNPDFSNLALQVGITILNSCDVRLLIPDLHLVLMMVVEALSKNVPELTNNALKILQGFESIDKNLVNFKMPFYNLELAYGLCLTLSGGMDDAVECAFKLLNKYCKVTTDSTVTSHSKYESLVCTPSMDISFKKDHSVALPLDKLIRSAFHIIHPKPDNNSLLEEFLKIIKYFLSSVLSEDYCNLLNQALSNLSVNSSNQSLENLVSEFDAIKPIDSHRFIFMGILAITSYNHDIKEISLFFEKYMIFYTAHCLHEAISPASKENGIEGSDIVDAISYFLSFCSGPNTEIEACIEKSLNAFQIFIEISETALEIKMWKLPLFEKIWKKVCLLCYEKAWQKQIFACKAMQLFINLSPKSWKSNHLAEFIMHLLHVIKLSNLENSLQCSAEGSALPGSILQNTFSVIKENLKDILNPVLEVSVTGMFSTCEAVRNQSKRLFKFLRRLSSLEIEIVLPNLPRIKLMLENLSRIDKLLESVPLKSQVGTLDGLLFLLDVWPKILEIIGPNGVRYIYISCNFALNECLASSKISDDHTDFCKRAFKLLFFWCKEHSAVELLNKALQCDSHGLFSSTFEICYKLRNALPIRRWLRDSKRQLADLQVIRKMRENAGEEEFPTIQNFHLLKHIRYLCGLLVLSKEHLQQEDQLIYSFILDVVLNYLRKSSDFSLELKWRRVFKNTFFVLDDVKDVFRHVVGSVFKYNPERIIEFIIVEFLRNNKERKLLISFFIDDLFRGKLGQCLHPVLLNNDTFIRDVRLSNILYPLEPDILQNKYIFLNWMLCGGDRSRIPKNGVYESSINKMFSTPNELAYLGIELIHYIQQYNENMNHQYDDLFKEPSIAYALRKIWSLLEKQNKLFPQKIHVFPRLKQHSKLAVLLMEIFKFNNKVEVLFELLKAPVDRFPEHFQFLTDFLKVEVIEKQSDTWQKEAFVKFVLHHANKSFSTDLEIKILEDLIIPSFIFLMKRQDVSNEETNDINTEFQKAVLFCFEELTESECEINKQLLQLSCVFLESYCNSEDFQGELMAFARNHIQQPDFRQNFCDPLTNSYWDLFSTYLLKIVNAKFTLDVHLKIQQNSLSFYTPDVREVSTCTLDILIPNMCSERGGSLYYAHSTSKTLEDVSLSVCRFHLAYKDKKKECFAKRLLFEHMYHAIGNNFEECILNTGFMHLLLDVINGMKNIDKVKYICETFEMILDYVIANENNTNLSPLKCSSLRKTTSSVAKMLFELPILKPGISKIDEKSCRKIFNICRKIHYLDSVRLLRLYPNDPERRLGMNDILVFLRQFGVKYCIDFILNLQNVDTKIYLYMNSIDLLVFFSETSKIANLMKNCKNFKEIQKSAWVKFFKATDTYLKMCFWQPENTMSLDEFPDFPFQNYSFLKEYVLDLKEMMKGFIDFLNQMVKNLVLLAADFSHSSQNFREKIILYINLKFIRCLLNLEKLMEEDLDPKVGEDSVASLKFICNCVYHTVGWKVLKLVVTNFSECLNSIEFIELANKVLKNNLGAITATSIFNTDEEKLIIILKMIEFGFFKMHDCGNIRNLLIRLAEVIKSKEIFVVILSIIRRWFIKDLKENICAKEDLLNLLKMVFNRTFKTLEFSKDNQVCAEYFKLMKLVYSCYESEYQHDPFLFDSVILHSGIPETRTKFIHMCNSLTLNDVMKHLPCDGPFHFPTPFSLTHCFELVTSTTQEMPMESSKVYIEALSPKKKLDIILEDLKSFKADLGKINPSMFFDAVLKLSEVDNGVLNDMWSNLFPELWGILLEDTEGKKSITRQYEEFIKNVLLQEHDWENTDIRVFVDVFFSCNSLLSFSHSFLRFIGKFPGLSKRIFTQLEDFTLENDLDEIPNSEIYLQVLSKAYFELKDDDLLSGFHQIYSKCPEICAGILHQNLGDFCQASDEYKNAMKRKIIEPIENEFDEAEMDLLRSYRIKCAKQLEVWDDLKETNTDLEIKDTNVLSKSCKYLERAFQENKLPLSEISPVLKASSYVCIKELKSLSPFLFTPNHTHLLQAGRMLLEFEIDYQLQTYLQGDVANCKYSGALSIFQSWFTNMPSFNDDLSFWNDLTINRLNQLKIYQSHIEQKVSNIEILKQKAKSVAQFAYNSCLRGCAKAFYSHGLPNLSVKLLQQCKALQVNADSIELYLESLLLEMKLSKNDLKKNKYLQAKAYNFLKNEFSKTTTEAEAAMCNIYQGLILSKVYDQSPKEKYENLMEDTFFVSYQKLTDWSKGWLYCGNFFQKRFNYGVERCCDYALRSFIRSCKYDNTLASMEPLSKIIWLLSFSSEVPLNLRVNIIEDITQIPISYWLPFIPQLLAAFIRIEDCHLSFILHNISSKHPESIYFLLNSVMYEYTLSDCMSENEENLKYQSCLEIMDSMQLRHPVLVSFLKEIENEFVRLSEKIKPNILVILRRMEIKICDLLFLCSSNQITVDSMYEKLQDMLIQSQSSLESECHPELKILISDLLNFREKTLEDILGKLSECISSYTKMKKIRKSFTLDPYSFLSSFCTEQVQIFTNSYVKHQPSVFISRILPKIDLIEKNGKSSCRIFIEGNNGKIYPYAIMPNYSMASFLQENRISQLFLFLNDLLQMESETSKRLLKFCVPSIIPIHPRFKIMEDDVSSTSLLDIFEMNCTKVEENDDSMTPILSSYFELFMEVSSSPDDFKIFHAETLFETIQESIVPRTILKQEFQSRIPLDYYELRRRFSRDISLYYFAQYCFFLNQRIPEKFYINQDSASVANFGSVFTYFVDVIDPAFSQDVPFLMTPNISEFITPIGILGYVKLAICAAARCLYKHNEKLESVLKTICLTETADCLFTDISRPFAHEEISKFTDNVNNLVEDLADIRGFGGQVDPAIALSEDSTKLSLVLPSCYPWL